MEYEELRNHVMEFFGDQSRSAEETKDELENLCAEIEMLIDSLKP